MQVETPNNMKSQVGGVRKSSEEAEENNKSHKRLKVVHYSAETSSQFDISNSDYLENPSDEENFANIHVISETNFPNKIFENEPPCDSYTNGSMNNGNRSSYDENLNSGDLNKIPSIIDNDSSYENGYTADVSLGDTRSMLDSSNQAYSESQLTPPILDQYNGQNEHIVLSTSDIQEVNENPKIKESSSSEPVTEKSVVDEQVYKSTEAECSSLVNEESQSSTSNFSPTNLVLDDMNSIPEDPLLSSDKFDSDPCCSQANAISAQTAETVSDVDMKYLGIYSLKTTQLEGHSEKILSVAADENIVLSSSGDTTVKVWDVENQKEMNNFAGHRDAVTSVILLNPIQSNALAEIFQWNDVLSVALSASLDCNIKVWCVSSGKELASMYTFNSITCMEYLGTDLCLIGTEGGKLEVWRLSDKKKIESVLAHSSSVSKLKVIDYYIFTISNDGTVKVWLFEEEELQPLYTRRRREISKSGNDMGPSQWKSIAVSNDMVYLGDNTPLIKTLDWKLGRMRSFVNHLMDYGKCDAVIAENDILLSTSFGVGSDNATINVWSLPEMTYVGSLAGDTQDIFCLDLVRFENKVRIVSGGHQLLVWDFNLKEPCSKNSTFKDYFFQEIDGLGVEISEKPKEIIHPIKLDSSSSLQNKEVKKQCTIL